MVCVSAVQLLQLVYTGPVVDNKNTQSGSDAVASSGTPLPRTQEADFGVKGKNAEITHGADLTKETGKAFTQEKVDGAASGEKHLDSSLNKQQVPAGARELKEVLKSPSCLYAQSSVHAMLRDMLLSNHSLCDMLCWYAGCAKHQRSERSER